MFKVALNPFFWANVSVSLIGDLGKPIEVSFRAKFKRLGVGEVQTLLDQVKAGQVKDENVIERALLDWGDMLDENDAPLAFTPDNLAVVTQIFGVRAAMVNAFFDAHFKAPEKNSEPLPGTTSGT